MRSQREAQMACDEDEVQSFAETLGRLRAQCENSMREYHQLKVETLWQARDGEGQPPKAEMEQMRLKLVMEVSFYNDKPVFPPANTRLSDELVYLATKFLSAKARGSLYPYDFTSSGDIRAQRVPSGPPPIIWAHGLPFFPVFRGYYILTGREHALWIGWKLRIKEWDVIKHHHTWSIGPVIAPASAVALRRSIDRQQRVHSPQAGDGAPGWESREQFPDNMSASHEQCTVFPRSANGSVVILPLWRVQGYHVQCGPNAVDGRATIFMPRGFFSELEDFDYDAEARKPYVNEKNPTVVIDAELDEMEDKGEREGQELSKHLGPIYCPPQTAVKHEGNGTMDTSENNSQKIKAQKETNKGAEANTTPMTAAAAAAAAPARVTTTAPTSMDTPKRIATKQQIACRRYLTLGQRLSTRFPKTLEVWNEIDRAKKLIAEARRLQETMLASIDRAIAESMLVQLRTTENQVRYLRVAIPAHYEAIGDDTARAVLADAYKKVFPDASTTHPDLEANTSSTFHGTTVTAYQPVNPTTASAGVHSHGNTSVKDQVMQDDSHVNPDTDDASASGPIKKEEGNDNTVFNDPAMKEHSTNVTDPTKTEESNDNTNVNDPVIKVDSDTEMAE